MPPLVVVPLPEEDETPDEADRPEEDEVPDDLVAEDVPDVAEVPGLLDDAGVAVVEACAKVAPMPAAAAADSRPTCQVIFLTRRWPRSLD